MDISVGSGQAAAGHRQRAVANIQIASVAHAAPGQIERAAAAIAHIEIAAIGPCATRNGCRTAAAGPLANRAVGGGDASAGQNQRATAAILPHGKCPAREASAVDHPQRAGSATRFSQNSAAERLKRSTIADFQRRRIASRIPHVERLVIDRERTAALHLQRAAVERRLAVTRCPEAA